jgi:glycosyltransferase involved in cell wall biosynthesis
MKADLHVHSRFSMRPSEWILKKLNCPESFTKPMDLYRIAKERGMDLVTITDHNCIDGCLELAHRKDFFISEEVTTYFPDDQCKLHVVVYNIDEEQHRDIAAVRRNVFDLVRYLNEHNIFHSLAHPLYSVNGKLKIEHFEKCLLLFRYFEINGARLEEQNQILSHVLRGLTPDLMNELADKHNLQPSHDFPWEKGLTGGSDDHSGLTIALRYTSVARASSVSDFFQGLASLKGSVQGEGSTPQTLAHNVYSIAYQYYSQKLNLGKYAGNDILLAFLDRFLYAGEKRSDSGILTKIHSLWGAKKKQNGHNNGNDVVLNLLRQEARQLIENDHEISQILTNNTTMQKQPHLTKEWFRFVNTVSNRLLFHFVDHIAESLAGAHFINLFQSIGAAGSLYAISAPYFLAYSIFSNERHFSKAVQKHFLAGPDHDIKVGHFTDTFYEINGVSRTLRQQIDAARFSRKNYVVITCDAREFQPRYGIQNFTPIGEYELSLYPEQKLCYPPFLEILDFCYEERFTHIHAATPGPLGLAALAVSSILKIPIVATYHTDLPQYAKYLTEDASMSDLVWKYIIWFYQHVDMVLVPSQATARELVQKGISEHKINIFPRGVDINLFHPSQAQTTFSGVLREDCFRLLYVGRVSKEKDLDVLVEAFKSLSDQFDDMQLIVVGDGPFRNQMEEELQDCNCCFTGYLNGQELASMYASCHAFVFPSTTDTFGNVVLEAQASGLPVIVTNKGGPYENVIPDETGLVIEGRNAKALESAIKLLYLHRDKLETMGQNARTYMERRDFQSAFDKAWGLYSLVNRENSHSRAQHTSSVNFDAHFFKSSYAMPLW